ncbi:MAG: SUMF1/EgtB/PvdO family nonheme iron enzyme [Myxococcota bacterium]|nr:SUMF1/EgtB/PvdO family nonheme iron enzyme [Myxococcota bacterium]
MPVGLKKTIQNGIYDLCGNTAEWCWDNYSTSWFTDLKGWNYYNGTCENPTGPKFGEKKVARGGSFTLGHQGNRTTFRRSGKGDAAYNSIGIRFVRTIT